MNWVSKKKNASKSWGKTTVYRDITYRSKWEVYVAVLLTHAALEFEYEHQRYFLGNGISYLPDFYVNQYKCYLEVKGYLTEHDKTQILMFRQKQRTPLVYLGEKELSYILGKPASNISRIKYINRYVPTGAEIQRLKAVIARTVS